MLVPRVRRASPPVERTLHEAASEEPHRGAIVVGALRALVIDDQRLGNRLGDLLQPRTLPLGRREGVIDLVARHLEVPALGVSDLARLLRGVAGIEGGRTMP